MFDWHSLRVHVYTRKYQVSRTSMKLQYKVKHQVKGLCFSLALTNIDGTSNRRVYVRRVWIIEKKFACIYPRINDNDVDAQTATRQRSNYHCREREKDREREGEGRRALETRYTSRHVYTPSADIVKRTDALSVYSMRNQHTTSFTRVYIPQWMRNDAEFFTLTHINIKVTLVCIVVVVNWKISVEFYSALARVIRKFIFYLH